MKNISAKGKLNKIALLMDFVQADHACYSIRCNYLRKCLMYFIIYSILFQDNFC